MTISTEKALEKHVTWLESLNREAVALDVLKGLYLQRFAHLRDPFNDVAGIENLHHVFDHMFDQIDDIGFQVTDVP